MTDNNEITDDDKNANTTTKKDDKNDENDKSKKINLINNDNLMNHDRAKNVPIDVKAPFLKALKVTVEDGRPSAAMADKLRQIQKFVEILSGLIDKSQEINKRISNHMMDVTKSNIENNESNESIDKNIEKITEKNTDRTANKKKTKKTIKSTNDTENTDIISIPKLPPKPPLRVVDMGSGLAYLTFSTHTHLSKKFELGT